MLNKVTKMARDFDALIQTYKWTPYKDDIDFGNKLPFEWKCGMCGTITEILETDATKSYDCSNPRCLWKLKFIM